MKEIAVSWTWELQSALHCGSGMSRAGHADRLVQCDHNGAPVIVGDAVKGAVRLAAEQLASWLGHQQEYRGDSNGPYVSEPRVRPLALVFGGDAHAHFSPAILVGAALTRTVASTAIDRRTGTAAAHTLRTIEVVPAGTRFASSLVVVVPDEDADTSATLIIGSLAAVENIGAKAGIGWGATRFSMLETRIGTEPVQPQAFVTEARLVSLETALRTPWHWVTPMLPPTLAVGSGHRWFRLDLALEEPVTLGRGADVSNRVTTDRSVRATTLRGAMARAWRRSGGSDADILQWLDQTSCWSPAFPVIGNGVAQVPVPASLMSPKRQRSMSLQSRALYDDLLAADRPSLPGAGGEATHWVGVGAGVMGWVDGGPADTPTPTSARMHVARDYRTGSKVQGALFSRESLPGDGARFVALACLPPAAASRVVGPLWLGKRNSAGNGQALLQITPIDRPGLDLFGGSRFSESMPNDKDVYIQLLSPAILRDPGTGYPLRTLDSPWWRRFLKLGVADLAGEGDRALERSRSRTVTGQRGGWMSPWRHPRSPVTTVEQGSVWRLRCSDVAIAQKVREQFPGGLGRIGERQHEGFGWIAVDPAWLGISRAEGRHSTAGDDEIPAPLPWPGAGALSHAQQLALLDTLDQVRLERSKKDLRAPLYELVRQAREASNEEAVAAIRSFFTERAQRGREDGWVALAGIKALPDPCWGGPDALRFSLEVLLIRSTPVSED